MESHKLKCTALMSTHLKFISVVGTLLLRQDRMDEAKTENNADILKEDEMKIVELIMTLPTRKRLLLFVVHHLVQFFYDSQSHSAAVYKF